MAKAFQKLSNAISRLKLSRRESEDDMSKRKADNQRSAESLLTECRPSSSHSSSSSGEFYHLRNGPKRRRSFSSKRSSDEDILQREGQEVLDGVRLRRHSFTVQISNTCPADLSPGCHGETAMDHKSPFIDVHITCPMGDMYSADHYQHSARTIYGIKAEDKLEKIVGSLQFEGFTPTHVLHRGQFSTVLLAYSKQQQISRYTTLKILQEDAEKSQDSQMEMPWLHPSMPQEVAIHKDLHHEHILQLSNYMTIQNRTILFLEFCDAGNLENLVRQNHSKGFLVEPIARRYFFQILSGLIYLHHQNIVHRSLQPRNILINSYDNLKICDFHSSKKVMYNEKLHSNDIQLTPYHAPEVFQGTHSPRQADVWSLGAVLYLMLTGMPPYGEDMDIVQHYCLNNKFIDLPEEKILLLSYDAYGLLKGLLQLYPDARFSLARTQNYQWNPYDKNTSLQHTVFIGNFHLSRAPHKLLCSPAEQLEKINMAI